ncbi:ATP-dependent DNA helicase [Spirochaeta isovalerica]|uniref:DNA excision repair protein ERCC-2 n=1 Tax=Spirochaeta isovalerica TaxID=150 RepID=A0A841RE32_9SPIO|nr:ATP-dependent DNA helicase [Spirochaeta isovalerica]MBB6481641.1 DNA excision repair protein ERCC-2 [Spirochaeta isovalerica]
MGLTDPRHISVRELIAAVHLSGDLVTESWSNRRAVEGTKGHKIVQESRGDDYQKEVKVSGEFKSEELVLIVDGRMDGLLPASDLRERPLIEEIKTVTESFPPSWEETPEEHRLQLLSYAWLYCREEDLDKTDIQLTYYHMTTGEEKSFSRTVTPDDAAPFIMELTSSYLFLWSRSVERNRDRNESIRGADFPYGDFRGPQREMSVAVYRTLREKGKLMVEAPTGTGKTMGALFPAFKALGENLGDRIFYATARTPGRLAAEEAFSDLLGTGMKCRAVSLTAKQKICFNPGRKCAPDECSWAENYYGKLSEVLESLEESTLFNREKVEELAVEHHMCPFELSLDISLVSDLLICDYNYIFDPLVKLKRYFQFGRGEDYFLLTDEAHNLPDRSRDMFSASINKKAILEVKREVKESHPVLARRLEKINKILLEEMKNLKEENRKWDERDKIPEALRKAVGLFLEEADSTDAGQTVLDLTFEMRRFYRISELAGEQHTVLIRRKGQSCLTLSLLNMDPAPLLEKAFKQFRSSVLFSATLIPSQYFCRTLFGEQEIAFLSLPSPFPEENCSICIRTDIETRYNKREESLPALCSAIERAFSVREGNYIVFFPSYSYMEQAVEFFRNHYPERDIHLQESGMTEEDRSSYLDRFSRDGADSLLAFAVMGGIFGEGIDLKGEKLIGVMIVGPGLPGISVERDLYKKYYEANGERGFDYAYRLPGFNKVLQAAGRVIRSEKDRGLILLIDSRYGWNETRKLYPPYWSRIQYCRNEEQMNNTIVNFWRG